MIDYEPTSFRLDWWWSNTNLPRLPRKLRSQNFIIVKTFDVLLPKFPRTINGLKTLEVGDLHFRLKSVQYRNSSFDSLRKDDAVFVIAVRSN